MKIDKIVSDTIAQVEILEQQEYEERILVFKTNLTSDLTYDKHHLIKRRLACFKGTRKDFDSFCMQELGNVLIMDATYSEQSEIDLVEMNMHGTCVDRNRGKSLITEGQQRKQDYQYLNSTYR